MSEICAPREHQWERGGKAFTAKTETSPPEDPIRNEVTCAACGANWDAVNPGQPWPEV